MASTVLERIDRLKHALDGLRPPPPDGKPTRRLITVGADKTVPNNVRTSTGEMYYSTPPEQTKPAMSDLLDWYRFQEAKGEHPVIVAAAFHYRFVRIHPFDDGNGRIC